jgi:hypothetical protein
MSDVSHLDRVGVGYDLPPLQGSKKNLARYVHLPAIFMFGLPFFAEPRNLGMGKLAGDCRREAAMSAFDDHKDELQHYEQMLGAHRGRLAVTLDRVTNAMVLVGQHGVYCHSQRDPTKPTMDIQIITDELRKAKELIQSVMEDLRVERENRLRAN